MKSAHSFVTAYWNIVESESSRVWPLNRSFEQVQSEHEKKVENKLEWRKNFNNEILENFREENNSRPSNAKGIKANSRLYPKIKPQFILFCLQYIVCLPNWLGRR